MKRTLLVLVILLALPLAVHAQTATPEAPDAAVTAPAPHVTVVNLDLLALIIGVVILALIVALTVLGKDMVKYLALNVPQTALDIMTAAINAALDKLTTLAASTPSPVDDMGVAELRSTVDSLLAEVRALKAAAALAPLVLPTQVVPPLPTVSLGSGAMSVVGAQPSAQATVTTSSTFTVVDDKAA